MYLATSNVLRATHDPIACLKRSKDVISLNFFKPVMVIERNTIEIRKRIRVLLEVLVE